MQCREITPGNIITALKQIVGIAFFNYLAVCPIIAWFGRKQGSFFTGVGIAFFCGFCGIFAAGRGVAELYPITASLRIVRFSELGSESHTSLSGIAVLLLMVVLTAGILAAAPSYDKMTATPNTGNKMIAL